MASAEAAAGEASTSAPAAREKLIVVRVKRKSSQTRSDAFWLEINERPAKKAMLDFSSLSISEPSSSSAGAQASEEQPQVKKLLAQHIETVHHSETVGDVLHSLLLADSTKEIKSKTKEWNDRIKQDKKPDQLRSEARQRHEPVATFLESQWTQIQEKIRSQRKRTWCFWLVCAPSSLGLSFLVYSNKLKGEKVVKRLKRLEAEKGRLQVKELAKGAEEA